EKDFVLTVLDVNETGQLVATVAGPDSGVRGQLLTFQLGADLPGLPAGTTFSYAIDWDGDNVVDETVSGSDDTLVSHVYTESGSYVLPVTADAPGVGVSAPATHSVAVTPMALQDDPLDPGRTVLVIGGSVGDDVIRIRPDQESEDIKVRINEKDFCVRLRETFHAPVGRIIVYAQAGDDDVEVAGGIDIPAWLYGGDGNDRL